MKKLLIAATAVMLSAGVAQARDYVSIAGSSTVLPFATIIAEELGKNRKRITKLQLMIFL